MRVEITTRHCELSPFLKDQMRNGVEKLRRFDDALKDARIVVSFERNRYKIEAVVTANGGQLVSHAVDGTRRAAIRQVLTRLEAQVRKNRERILRTRKRAAGKGRPAVAVEPEEAAEEGIEAAGFGEDADYAGLVSDDPGDMGSEMMLAEAAAVLRSAPRETLGFTNRATGLRVLLFKRRDGRIGMVEIDR